MNICIPIQYTGTEKINCNIPVNWLPQQIIPEALLERCCINFGVSTKRVKEKNRIPNVVNAKRYFAFIMRRKTLVTLKQIATYLNCNHSGVIHLLKSFDDLCYTDRKYKADFEKFEAKINSMLVDKFVN